tara:strand:+ start:1682 stop:1981 length:300 start_codon:yes stop_codon:yes gene_type:complete
MPIKSKKFKPNWLPERVSHSRSIDNSAFYNSNKWRKFSRAYKDKNPLCVVCSAEGIVSPAQVADHIKQIIHGGKIFDINNIQSLCNYHHNSKTGKEGKT